MCTSVEGRKSPKHIPGHTSDIPLCGRSSKLSEATGWSRLASLPEAAHLHSVTARVLSSAADQWQDTAGSNDMALGCTGPLKLDMNL